MAGSTASDPALVARFAAALDRLNPEGSRIGLAVSGGPDSMAMLLLACEAIPGRFEVATVNHGLRPEAKDECALVAAACAEREVPCEVLTVRVAPGNVQAQAREARYAALGDWAAERNLAAVATAHHADDQAETLLMRLNRGSGVAGLAGVRAAQRLGASGRLIRPLLAFRRAELRQVVTQAAIQLVADPANVDDRYDRARMRKALSSCDWLDPSALAQSASHLADAYGALQDYARLLWPQLVRPAADGFCMTPATSREMNRRVLAMVMEEMGGKPRGGEVARLLDLLENGGSGNLAGIHAAVHDGEWVFRPETPRRSG